MDYKLLLAVTLLLAGLGAGAAQADPWDIGASGATTWIIPGSVPTAAHGGADRKPKISRGDRFRHMGSHRMAIAAFGWMVFFALLAPSGPRPPRRALASALALSALAVAYLVHIASTERYYSERGLHTAAVLAFAVVPVMLIANGLWPRVPWSRAAPAGSMYAAAALIAGTGAIAYALGVATVHRTQQPATTWAVAGGAALGIMLVLLAPRASTWRQRLHRSALLGVVLGSVYALVQFNPQGSLVLLHDQFHYFLGAKYFQELGYDKLYHCAAVAEMDNGRGALIAQQRIQDLRTNRLIPGHVVLNDPQPCRNAFTPQRWEAFRADVGYFRTHVSPESARRYLMDYGYNASPFWTAVNRSVIAERRASGATLRWLSGIDIVLLLGIFALLSWAFGAVTAVLAALLWGTSSIWMFEAQGAIGSFGRLYWVFAVVAAVCLLRKGWCAVAGLSLSVALVDRVFPGALLFGPAVVAGVDLLKGKFDQRLWRLLGGAVLGAGLLSAYAMHATGGPTTVQAFAQNSSKHVSSQPINNVGLPTLVSATWSRRERLSNYQWNQLRRQALERRYPVFVILAAAALLLAGWVCWLVREPWKLIIAGLLPMFALVAVSNYYYAVLILLAPWAAGALLRTALLLGIVITGQVIYQQTWPELTFLLYSALVLTLLLCFLGALAMDSHSMRRPEQGRRAGEPWELREGPSVLRHGT